MYFAVKHIHLTAIAISVALLLLRFFWVVTENQMMSRKWVKITPHIVDTVLLASALTLCVMIAQYPFVHGWVTEKVLGVVLYIFLGLVALKKAKTNAVRSVAMIGGLATLMAIAKIAVTKQSFFF
ncbi:MAG: SirB2 family protein [Aestuariibacter sp.]